jgi:deoxycytidylate deaminase
LHAEMRIMAQAKRKGVKTILVCRIGKSGNIRPINPCKTCSNKANDLGIKIISVNGG